MPVSEAHSEETPYGRYVTSDGWSVLSLADALAVLNEEKGGALYPLEPRESGEARGVRREGDGRA
jgi:hypothetical protein